MTAVNIETDRPSIVQYQFAIIEKDIRYRIFWRQHFTSRGGLIGLGSFTAHKRCDDLSRVMQKRIWAMRKAYTKRVTTLTNVDNLSKLGGFD